MNNLNFTALDFETMTGEKSSACAIGLVKVVDGVVVRKYYSLINPIPDNATHVNTEVNGITREMAAAAPDFGQLWPEIESVIGDDLLVSHSSAFDQAVWTSLLDHYHCASPEKYDFLCTYKATGLSLDAACEKAGIAIGTHHDALDDALACARLMCVLSRGELTIPKPTRTEDKSHKKTYPKDKKSYAALDESLVVNKDTPFCGKTVVYTGNFAAFPDRNELREILHSLGADIKDGISKKTQIVVVGSDAGPAKMEKIKNLQADGNDIRVMYEPELISILEGIK